VAKDLATINERVLGSASVRHRLVGTGVLTTEQALELGLVGMAARARGVAVDQRAYGLGAYEEVPMEVCTEPSGDCWARARLRVREIERSLAWLARVFAERPRLERSQRAVGALAPAQLAVAVCEGWRGEVVHCAETDADGGLAHYKVQDPSLRNWFGLALAVRENEISDFPICNKSFDLSYCGHDL
jgi:Ni,Fe-hydrogenase III large subunit